MALVWAPLEEVVHTYEAVYARMPWQCSGHLEIWCRTAFYHRMVVFTREIDRRELPRDLPKGCCILKPSSRRKKRLSLLDVMW